MTRERKEDVESTCYARRRFLSVVAKTSIVMAIARQLRGLSNVAVPQNTPLASFAPIYNDWEVLGRPRGVRGSQEAAEIVKDASRWLEEGFPVQEMAYQIDATWSREYGDQIADPRKYPQGMRATLDAIRRIGWKYTGLWIEVTYALAESNLAKRHPDWLDTSRTLYPFPNTEFGARRPAFLLNPGKQSYQEHIRQQTKMLLLDYGADMLKVDQLRYAPKELLPEFLRPIYETKLRYKPIAAIEGHLDLFSSTTNNAATARPELDREAMEYMDQVRVYDLPVTESVVADQRYRMDLLYKLAPDRTVIHPDAFEGLGPQLRMKDLFREVTFQQVLMGVPVFFQQPFGTAFKDAEPEIRDALEFYLNNTPHRRYRYSASERKVGIAPQTVSCNCSLPEVSGGGFVNLLKTDQGRYAVGLLDVDRRERPSEVSFPLSDAKIELVIFNYPSLRLRFPRRVRLSTAALKNRAEKREDISHHVKIDAKTLVLPSDVLRRTRARVNQIEIEVA
jgi:Melibiase